MMDYGADQGIQWKNIMNKVWSNRNLGLVKNIKKDIKFMKKIIGRSKRATQFQLDIKIEKVTSANIQQLFQKYDVPKNFDLLSIDIDFNDYWVWEAIVDYCSY